MISVKLRKKKVSPEKRETAADGVIDSIKYTFIGEDSTPRPPVEFKLTIKRDDSQSLPPEYEDLLGERWDDEITLMLRPRSQQEEL